MEISTTQCQQAAKAGVWLLSQADTKIPASLVNEVVMLRGILGAIASGKLVVAAPQAQERPPSEPPATDQTAET